MGFHAWITAWEAAMAEAGYPRARIDWLQEMEGLSYGWVSDIDEFMAGLEQSHESWEAAHMAFLLVDSLRPEWLQPSLMLQQMLDEQT